jgi:hypothetical protein
MSPVPQNKWVLTEFCHLLEQSACFQQGKIDHDEPAAVFSRWWAQHIRDNHEPPPNESFAFDASAKLWFRRHMPEPT